MKPPARAMLIPSFALAAAALPGAPARAQHDHGPLLRAASTCALSPAEAVARADQETVNGTVYRVEYRPREGGARCVVSTLVDSRPRIIEFACDDGALISSSDGRSHRSAFLLLEHLKSPNIGLVQAIELAEAHAPSSKAWFAESVARGSHLQFDVGLATPDGLMIATLDAQGRVTRFEPPPPPKRK